MEKPKNPKIQKPKQFTPLHCVKNNQIDQGHFLGFTICKTTASGIFQSSKTQNAQLCLYVTVGPKC
jgi:hypothetical protein